MINAANTDKLWLLSSLEENPICAVLHDDVEMVSLFLNECVQKCVGG